MNYYSHYQTSQFKVKNPAAFQKEFEDLISGEGKYLAIEEKGFVIFGTNLTHDEYEQDEDLEYYDSFSYFLKQHVLRETPVSITVLHLNSKNASLASSFYFVTDLGISAKESSEVIREMEKNHYPRVVTCKIGGYNKETKQWIDPEKEYIAVEEYREKNREYYSIEQGEGVEISWGKEYFV